jgi:hypothetical protein
MNELAGIIAKPFGDAEIERARRIPIPAVPMVLLSMVLDGFELKRLAIRQAPGPRSQLPPRMIRLDPLLAPRGFV